MTVKNDRPPEQIDTTAAQPGQLPDAQATVGGDQDQGAVARVDHLGQPGDLGLAAHLAGSGDPEAFVFTAPEGGPLRVHGFRARVWRPATRRAGQEGLRIHDLRHTAAALWIAAQAGPKEVAARAGHTSVSFTLDRHGHLYPEAETALRDRLDALYVAGEQAEPGVVIELPRDRSRPQRGPGPR
jgi:hypothetical protein